MPLIFNISLLVQIVLQICPLLGAGHSGIVEDTTVAETREINRRNRSHSSFTGEICNSRNQRAALSASLCKGDADGAHRLSECLGTWGIFLLPWFGGLALAEAVQLTFIYFIFNEQAWLNECNQTHPVLRAAGVFVLTSHCVSDMLQTFDMGVWTYRMRTTKITEILQLTWKVNEDKPFGYASGISRMYKVAVGILVLLPKAFIGITLWWYGAGFIANSPDDVELILNTVAVLFVLEVDDQLFIVTVPTILARRIELLPGLVEISGSTYIADCCTFFGQYLRFGVIAAMTVVVIFDNCGI